MFNVMFNYIFSTKYLLYFLFFPKLLYRPDWNLGWLKVTTNNIVNKGSVVLCVEKAIALFLSGQNLRKLMELCWSMLIGLVLPGRRILGCKIIYSGYPRPCPELVKASCGATILVDEANFEEADAKNHSTFKGSYWSRGCCWGVLHHLHSLQPKIPAQNMHCFWLDERLTDRLAHASKSSFHILSSYFVIVVSLIICFDDRQTMQGPGSDMLWVCDSRQKLQP